MQDPDQYGSVRILYRAPDPFHACAQTWGTVRIHVLNINANANEYIILL